ncbi:MAG TPA: MaoC family dehydratase N-terminal domain-containing protein [Terriglobia bacterium]|nr:MaoC family dehydratase N-terminal domain-containing protein [Terriglobia bacterium]
MTAIDIEACKGWIGRSTEDVDIITPRLLNEYRVTFDPFLADVPGLQVPLGFHWCLSPLLAPLRDLGPDGHPAKGSFLPPVPLPRRMWAGGAIDFHGDLRPGDHVRRRSTIASIDLKQGRSGQLCFVGLRHDYQTERGLALSELQNIVYRDAPAAEQPAQTTAPGVDVAAGDGVLESSWSVDPTPTMLFRYSALTFNGHRIHYDYPYATAQEGYAGLVVHGPMQAALMLNLAAASRRAVPRRFSYRGLVPLIAGQAFRVRLQHAEPASRCFTQIEGGLINMQGEAVW